MVVTNPILSDVSAGISELKKNPMSVVEQGDGSPVAILNRNKPVFYAVPANVYESMMDAIEDIELAALVESRKNQDEVSTSVQQLINDL
ncbi:MAG: antitoxin [Candidatus Thioglobus sp.]|jgi:antitoxin StbD|uniref:type II toxin-antitoxin system Phd/YefM family antitoxin n=1 Tax=Candidatus Thioglobus sp. TaxID=2026721 RepID=UPI001EB6D162|nr:type II toxin-antitoxin system Phd/YefM family antitoxin [Candidatus Thioglobus sp.]MBT3187339.1 antitoxin [Candidatus Thioglobus sp.]